MVTKALGLTPTSVDLRLSTSGSLQHARQLASGQSQATMKHIINSCYSIPSSLKHLS